MDNSFATPTPNLAKPRADNGTYDPIAFAVSGRLGRIRYFVYATAASLIGIALLVGVVGTTALTSGTAPGGALALVVLAIYGFMLASSVVLARRRLHDTDHSAWMTLLLLVPIVNAGFGLWLMFAPGTAGANQFGPAPSPNSPRMISSAWTVGALLFALFAVLLFLPSGATGR